MSDDIAVGIDLGTSTSCVAVVEGGRPRVLSNARGERTHASIVSFLPEGTVLVGNPAKKNVIPLAERTVYSAKRLIGRFFFSDEVRKAQAAMPYRLVEGPNHAVQIDVDGHRYSIPEISALVLKEMRAVAEAALGRPVTKAVVTCPAYFNDNQRQATRDAGRIAGLDVLRIINEPTAAALAYGFGKDVSQTVCVYDLGGGTFDVSVLRIGKDVFEVLATSGDTYLGGDDFDERIMGWLADDFQARHGVDLRQSRFCMQMLKEHAEAAKIAVGRDGTAELRIPALCRSPQGELLGLEQTLGADAFNKMVMDLVQRTFKVCDEALQSARLTAAQIDAVILVGGPTRLPVVRHAVRHYFGREPLADVDPDEVVAAGASIQAAALIDGAAAEAGLASVLLDVTPLTLRIGTVGGFTEKVIDKNSPIPIEKAKTFTTSRDGQERVRIRVYQGEASRADACELLGEFEFSGFRVARRGEVQIEVTFEIDPSGIVNVSAGDRETGQRASTTISLSSGLSERELRDATTRTAGAELVRG